LKISCGVDIVEIARIKRSIERLGNRFLNKIFTEKEIEYCESHKSNKYQHYAARFSAKEAVYKALDGIVQRKKLTWKKFEVINDIYGKPRIEVDDDLIESVDISISHCKEYAVASVVVLHK